MQSKATTVAKYLAELPPDRRAAISAVRNVILDNLDPEIEETMAYGMIGYAIPHSVFPAGYHCDPKQGLPFAALASQKNYMSLYLMSVYCGCDGEDTTEHARWFVEAWKKSGKKLDRGKACLRFNSLDDLALDVIGEAIKRVTAKKYIAAYEAARAKTLAEAPQRSAARAAAKKTSSAPKKSKATRG